LPVGLVAATAAAAAAAAAGGLGYIAGANGAGLNGHGPGAVAVPAAATTAALAQLGMGEKQRPWQESPAAPQLQHQQVVVASPSGSLGMQLLAQPGLNMQVPSHAQASQPPSMVRSRTHVAAPPLRDFVASQV
jgi:hypothetical protein